MDKKQGIPNKVFSIILSIVLVMGLSPLTGYALDEDILESSPQIAEQNDPDSSTNDDLSESAQDGSSVGGDESQENLSDKSTDSESSKAQDELEQSQTIQTAEVSDATTLQASVHVQQKGWMEAQNIEVGKVLSVGTDHLSLRLEAMKVSVSSDIEGSIEYCSHVQDYGWEKTWSKDGALSGTSGEAKRLEALKIRLTGDLANQYDIYYRTHVQDFGWLNWVKNGEMSGTDHQSKRIEKLEICLVEKGGNPPSGDTSTSTKPEPSTPTTQEAKIAYQTHVQSIGWQGLKYDGEMSGTDHQSKRLEAIKIEKGKLITEEGSIQYRTHVQDYGWMNWISDGAMSGTSGEAKRLEAIQIKLTGELADNYDVYYRVHAQEFGWLGWAKNGEYAGTQGFCYRLEAIEIQLVEKGGAAPGSTQNPFHHKKHVYGAWTDVNPATCTDSGLQERVCEAPGCSVNETRTIPAKGHQGEWTVTSEPTLMHPGSRERVCAVCGVREAEDIAQLSLTYQAHVQGIGWQTKKADGQMAGTNGQSKRVEALKIDLPQSVKEATGASVAYSSYIEDIGWQAEKSNGEISGTTGQQKRIEAFKVSLTGELADQYDIYYRSYIQGIGWLDWAANGQVSGTTSAGLRMEAFEVRLVEKGGAAPGVTDNPYLTVSKVNLEYGSCSTKDWSDVSAGKTSGTSGESLALTGIRAQVNSSTQGSIEYSANFAQGGWSATTVDGANIGAVATGNPVRAIKFNLTDDLSKYYDVYYRVHLSGYGWMGWAKNGAKAGVEGLDRKVEAYQMQVVVKGSAAPGSTSNSFSDKNGFLSYPAEYWPFINKANNYGSSTSWIALVDCTKNRTMILTGSRGNWKPYKYLSCTTGAPSTPTVKGVFTVGNRGVSFGSGYTCWYWTQFYGNYLFHSVLYYQGSKTAIKDGRLGINASHGCVRLNINEAKWIYDNIPRGTTVVVY